MDLDILQRQHKEIQEIVTNIKQTVENNNIGEDASHMAKQISMLAGKLRVHLATEDKHMYPYLLQSEDAKVRDIAKDYADEMGHISQEFMDYKDGFNTRTKIINNPQEFVKETQQIFKILEERMFKEDTHLYKMEGIA